MTTEFQRKLIKDIDTLWVIVKLFHPSIIESFEYKKDKQIFTKQTKDTINAYWHYDWVCIDLKVPGYGNVRIGINNSAQYKLYGPRVTKEEMKTALEDGTIFFDVWRFAGDTGGVKNDKDPLADRKYDEPAKIAAVELLKSKGYTLQSVDEFYKIYYAD